MLLAILLGTFVAAVILRHWIVTARTLATKTSRSLPPALFAVARNDPHYWGGQLSHLGVAVLVIGIAVSAGRLVERPIVLEQGETARVAGFELTYEEPINRQEAHRTVLGASVLVSRPWGGTTTLEPRLNDYTRQGQIVATPSVMTTLRGDLYLSLDRIDDTEISMKVFWFPFIWLIWVGGFVTAAATLWAFVVPRFARRDEPSPAPKSARG